MGQIIPNNDNVLIKVVTKIVEEKVQIPPVRLEKPKKSFWEKIIGHIYFFILDKNYLLEECSEEAPQFETKKTEQPDKFIVEAIGNTVTNCSVGDEVILGRVALRPVGEEGEGFFLSLIKSFDIVAIKK
jgi:hypothetical protein